MQLFVGVDVGTQGIRVGIVDKHGEIIASDEKSYDTYYPKPSHVEQEPDDWWNGFETIFSSLLDSMGSRKKYISTICVCATSSTVLAVDANGKPLTKGIMWMDNRSAYECEAINNTKHEALKYCGYAVSPEWIIAKCLWIKNNQRNIFDECHKIVEQLDWFNFNLTGKWVSSQCNVTCKFNYIKDRGGWQEDYFNTIGFSEYKEKIATDVIAVGDKISNITNEIASKFGLKEDISVIMGAIDAHIGMIGAGVISENKVSTVTGSSFVHLLHSKQPYFTDSIWGPYNKALFDDYWLLELGQISAASIVKWFKNEFCKEVTNSSDINIYDVLSKEAALINHGSDGLICLDFFQGNRTPYKDPFAKGCFYGLTLSHTRAHLFRSILEGVAFGMKNIFNIITDDLGIRIDEIVLSGGLTKDSLWLQIISDITGYKVSINKNSLTGVMGCAVCAAVYQKVYSGYEEAVMNMIHKEKEIIPDKNLYEIYNKIFDKYKKLYQSTKAISYE